MTAITSPHEPQSESDGSSKQRLLSYPAAAASLHISERKLWGLKASGTVPHVKIGASVRFRPADLDAYVDTLTSGGSSK